MADPEARARDAAAVADHAADLLHDVQELARVLPPAHGELAPVLAILERLVGQVEDLAAAQHRGRHLITVDAPAIEAITASCSCGEWETTGERSVGGVLVAAGRHVDEQRWVVTDRAQALA